MAKASIQEALRGKIFLVQHTTLDKLAGKIHLRLIRFSPMEVDLTVLPTMNKRLRFFARQNISGSGLHITSNNFLVVHLIQFF